MLDPEWIGGETRVGNQLGELESAAEAGPLLVTLDTDRQVPAIRALKRLVRCGGGSGAAERLRLPAGCEVLGQPRGLERHCRGQHFDFDKLAAAGPLACDQRLQHRLRDCGRGGEIQMGQVTEHLAAAAFWPGYAAPTTKRLDGGVDSGLTR